ncbi:hypothetical protein QFC24_006605 [Naganishia onofrii]|uniref:Uncharacterized protein n=1 Tax=Naganishia onofrii TaxID=1851511 RepID=A0ACC2WYD0_9TREE|nr:hypothetical protein QFC24_006605 [Naganishia onofrii]
MPDGASALAGSATVSKAGRKRINVNDVKPRRISSSSSQTAGSSSSSGHARNAVAKYTDNYWYWLFAFALPHGFYRSLEVVETFDTYYYCKPVCVLACDNPAGDRKGTWNHPFSTFIYIACELLLPVTPFGGFGHAGTASFWGEALSRNKVIAKIVSYATGKDYDHKAISSHKQTIIKSLLWRFGDTTVDDYARYQAGSALHQFAGITSLETFLHSFISRDPQATGSPDAKCTRERRLKASAKLLVEKYKDVPAAGYREESCRNRTVLALDPFLAFFLGLNGSSSANTSFNRYFKADQALRLGQSSQSSRDFGRDWFNANVMTNDADAKAAYAKNWWKAFVERHVGRQDARGFCMTDDVPPASDGGQFKQRPAFAARYSRA